MKTVVECIPCLINQGIKISNFLNLDAVKKGEIVREIMSELQSKTLEDSTPPHLAKDIYKLIYSSVNNDDPYFEIKEYYNKELLKLEDDLRKLIYESEDSFHMALKLAITGNIIDFGTNHEITKNLIYEKIEEVEDKNLAIDNSKELYDKLKNSKQLMYLGDNCGEIVFDKLFIAYLKQEFPDLNIIFGVRGMPIINDITLKDAKDVGINLIASLIDNGDGAPGTIIDNTKKEFKDSFYKSDLIIAKGQGNFETLSNINREDVFFLLMAKCNVISTEIGVPLMSLICKKNNMK